MSAFLREAFKACLYGYADKQQQQSVASALILANGLKFDLANALQEQIDECFDDRCEMCLRHEAVIAKALGQSKTPASPPLNTPAEAGTATDAPSSIDTPPAGAVRGAASANRDDVA